MLKQFYLKHKTYLQNSILGTVISKGFEWVNRCYNFLYDHHFFKSHQLDCTIISIGNVSIGGSGKTPFCILLAKALEGRKKSFAFVFKGYGARKKVDPPIVLSIGDGPQYDAQTVSDEAVLVSQKFPNHVFVVGKDRQKACLIAKEHAPILILDDAMQHRKLAKDFEVVILDKQDPFGRKNFFPAGFLRDHLSQLQRAHLVVGYNDIEQELRKWTSAPFVQVAKVAIDTRPIVGKKVAAFTAVANPQSVYETLNKAGALLMDCLELSDHSFFDLKDLEHFSKKAKEQGIELLVCTEKDATKIDSGIILALPVYILKIELNIKKHQDEFDQFLDKLEKIHGT
jgi:tetraacyldisaccharide 4'-kinase